MNIDKAVLSFAGFVVLIGLALGYYAFTGFCPAAIVFRKLGLRSGNAFS